MVNNPHVLSTPDNPDTVLPSCSTNRNQFSFLAYSFAFLLNQPQSNARKTIRFEVMRGFQRPAKVYDKRKRKWSHFLPIECLSKIKLGTQKSYLEWLDHKFKSKALSDALPSKFVSTLIKIFRFHSNHGQLECKHQTSRIQIWPIRFRHTSYVFETIPQTIDANLIEMCGVFKITFIQLSLSKVY